MGENHRFLPIRDFIANFSAGNNFISWEIAQVAKAKNSFTVILLIEEKKDNKFMILAISSRKFYSPIISPVKNIKRLSRIFL